MSHDHPSHRPRRAETTPPPADRSRPKGPSVRVPAPIVRDRLLRQVTASPAPRAVIVSAPAGSGKSVFLAQWRRLESRPVAWLTCTDAHADPMLLVHDLAKAVGTVTGPGPVADVAARTPGSDPYRSMAGLLSAMSAEPEPGLVVIDDAHRAVGASTALDLLVTLIDQLPDGWTVAIAKREILPLPTARWLARGIGLVQVGLRDLVLSEGECLQLLNRMGVPAAQDTVGEVLQRTEGWPVAVYLTGLTLLENRPIRQGRLVAGDDALLRSYLESEILATIAPADLELLRKTSILREVSGPLAAAVTGFDDAADRLTRLSRTNLLVMPVDSQERWFRYHGLLVDLFARQLEDGADDAPALHARAAAWYEKTGDPDGAVRHWLLANEDEAVRRVVLATFAAEYRRGHTSTVQRWMRALPPRLIADDPQLALAQTMTAALEGDQEAALRSIGPARLDDPDGDAPEGYLDRAFVRAVLCERGPETMRDDALAALQAHGPEWPWGPAARMALGSAERMLGRPDAAQEAFRSLELTPGAGGALARLIARAERAQDAMDRRAWAEAEALLAMDRSFVLDVLDPTNMVQVLWLATDARLQVHRGDVRAARSRLTRAQMGRTHLGWIIPWYGVRSLVEMARSQLLLSDAAGATASLAQAREIMSMRSLLGELQRDVDEVDARRRATNGSRRGGTGLSPAELRLLPMLQTYMTFKEIGERLSISANTVKTEVLSIYAKLGASTRGEAVELAIQAGLLEDVFAHRTDRADRAPREGSSDRHEAAGSGEVLRSS